MEKGVKGKARILVALDVDTIQQAEELVLQLAPYVGGFKVGLQLATGNDLRSIIDMIHGNYSRVFVDLKLHDIPETMAKASKKISSLSPMFFNVHASAGIKAMRVAVENGGLSRVLAVTVLTSFIEEETHLIYGAPVKAKVLQFARDAKLAGVQGLVCSAKEVEFLRAQPELASLTLVTPGIRPLWSRKNDQERVVTPADAVKFGTDYLVIGLPITNPPHEIGTPVMAVEKIVEEIKAAEFALGIQEDEDEHQETTRVSSRN
jgi:orotidine-5'-phosphate decarboxylase